jgi:integrase
MSTGQGYYVTSEEMRDMLFPQAAEVWLASKAPYISPKTFHEYELNIATISKFFENFTLKSISADAIRVYQKYRGEQCGPFSINHECSVIQQMLKRVGLWNQIEPNYQALPLPLDSVGRVLTDDERKRLFEAAQTNPNLEAAYLFALIAVNTTGGPKEISSLRLRDINLEARTIEIPKEAAKNVHRVRCIPLNLEAYMAVTLAINRAKRLGSLAPDHYLFPFRIRGGNSFRANYDPTRKQTTFKTAWKKILQKAGIEGRFRMYDLRHTAITTLLENPNTSQETAEAIAGHISRRIQKRYSHIGLLARRQAVCALDGSQASESPKNAPPLLPEDALTNADVIEMLITDGLPAQIVVEKIKKAKNCLFDTSREALKELRAAGVSDSVLVAMVRAS